MESSFVAVFDADVCVCLYLEGEPMFDHKFVHVNPFTAPACKISRLNDAQTRQQTVHF